MNFRTDINGLRAIAVIAVVLFHFNPSFVPGGFAGVDIFFVISGYLMTNIILRGLQNNTFSIFKFYVARANRIIPPLAFVCLTLVIFGWFYLYPEDYKQLGKHIGGSIFFISNMIYWHESGYFDVASREKWLLHTWSLSVEWQFYMIYPIVMLVLHRYISLKNIKKALLIGTAIGFLACIYATIKWPTLAYYSLPTRAWEMMFGGVAFLYPLNLQEKAKKYIEAAGVLLIILSYAFINSNTPWPGYLATFPVIGSFIIITANRQSSYITDNVIFRYIGKWSYSIYLWHWPLVVLGYYFNIEYWIFIGIPLSILLGWVSYQYIETIKFKSLSHWKNLISVKPFYYALVIATLGSSIFISQGRNFLNSFMTASENADFTFLEKEIVLPQRSNGFCFYSFDSDVHYQVGDKKATECILGDKKVKPETLLFGSSFAGMYDPMLDKIFKQNGASYNSVTTNWCTPLFTASYTGPSTHIAYQQCQLDRAFLKNVLKNKTYKNIIIGDQWNTVNNSGFMKEVEDFVREASERGINVIILPSPKGYIKNPIPVFFREFLSNTPINLTQLNLTIDKDDLSDSKMAAMAQKYEHVYFIPRDSVFDNSGLFKLKEKELTVPYTWDGEHISKIGSQYATIHFINSLYYKDVFKNLIQKSLTN